MTYIFTVSELINSLSETIGYKTGLALNKEQLAENLNHNDEWQDLVYRPEDEIIRIRGEELEDLFAELYYRVGHIDAPVIPDLTGVWVFHKYKNEPHGKEIYNQVYDLFIRHLNAEIESTEITDSRIIDPTKLLQDAFTNYGKMGFDIAYDLLGGLNTHLELSVLSCIRRVDWADTVELDKLFKSASLNTQYGYFLDQRFIDYLNRNFEKIDQIHWRKFEGLAAEYFRRNGYLVEIGPGMNDDGVDIRVWRPDSNINLPPLMLIQCKRQKHKVSKLVVKALWADVQFEGAKSGLIVTSSALLPGAKKIGKARQYPIQEANRLTLKRWLEELKTPGTGIFLGQ